jgi:hypothetical protein
MFDDLALDAFGGVDEFQRVLRVLLAGRTSQSQPVYRVAPRGLRLPQTRQALGTAAGVFLPGATQQQARLWAQQMARRMGGTVSGVERHGGGLPHFHIESPGFRSGHIFFGAPPRGLFFDEAY